MLKIFSTGDIISLSKLTKEGEGMNIGERIRNRREESLCIECFGS